MFLAKLILYLGMIGDDDFRQKNIRIGQPKFAMHWRPLADILISLVLLGQMLLKIATIL